MTENTIRETLRRQWPASSLAAAIGPAKGVRRLTDVYDLVQTYSRGSWDALVPRDQLTLRDGRLTFPAENGKESSLLPTHWATGQLCARLGIPAPYFRKCPTALQDIQASYWLREPSALKNRPPQKVVVGEFVNVIEARAVEDRRLSRWRLRARGEALRAVLSERYSPLDNAQLLDVLLPLLDRQFPVDWLEMTDEALHLRIVDPRRAREVLPGDELTVGIHIANSEVGFRALTVDALVYRLVCSNGLVRLVQGKSLLRQRHIHVEPSRLATTLETAIGEAWLEAEGFLEQMRRTTEISVEDVDGTIERLSERWNFSQSVQDDLVLSLRREPARIQGTVFGLVNAITNVAQRQPSEARFDMEVLAGHLAEHGVASYAPRHWRTKVS